MATSLETKILMRSIREIIRTSQDIEEALAKFDDIMSDDIRVSHDAQHKLATLKEARDNAEKNV